MFEVIKVIFYYYYYTIEEMRQYKLTVYDSKLVDLSNYINEHPGGSYILLEFIGRDITLDFDTYHYSTEACEQLQNLIIVGRPYDTNF